MVRRHDNGPYGIFAEAEITVEFFDCDPLKVVWHGNYFNYFEVGRRVLLEKIGYGYDEMERTGYSFPVIDASAKFLGSLRFRDRARVKAILEEYENRLRIKYEIRNIQNDILTTKGVSTQMAIDMRTYESCFVCPQVFIDKVEAFIKGETP
jgi:acyl-CoA thioester hydrolase